MKAPEIIHRELLDDSRRASHTAKLFGIRFPLYLESFVFDTAGSLSEQYDGGYWHFYALSNGAFYMAPDQAELFKVSCANGFEGEMSADAFGVTVCLYAYSQLSFSSVEHFSQACAQHFHWLRAYMLDHPEAKAIISATD